jgi:hypothetical protein
VREGEDRTGGMRTRPWIVAREAGRNADFERRNVAAYSWFGMGC